MIAVPARPQPTTPPRPSLLPSQAGLFAAPGARLALAALVGLNLFLLAGALPLLLARGEARPGLGTASLLAVALLAAPAALVAGLAWRSASALVVAFPLAAALPFALWDGARRAAPPLWLLVGGLIAYLLLVLRALAPPPAAASTVRALAEPPPPPRWRRRLRVARVLEVGALVVPVVLVGAVHAPALRRALEARHGEGAAQVTALLTLVVGVLALVAVRGGLARPLELFLSGDRALARELADARARAQTGRPRRRFYLWVLLAVALMAAALWWSSR